VDQHNSSTHRSAEDLAALDFAGREINRHAARAGDAIGELLALRQRLTWLVAEWRSHAADEETNPDVVGEWEAAALELEHELTSNAHHTLEERELGTGERCECLDPLCMRHTGERS